jgi:hypothetical protein
MDATAITHLVADTDRTAKGLAQLGRRLEVVGAALAACNRRTAAAAAVLSALGARSR